jgi:hypothetical protein
MDHYFDYFLMLQTYYEVLLETNLGSQVFYPSRLDLHSAQATGLVGCRLHVETNKPSCVREMHSKVYCYYRILFVPKIVICLQIEVRSRPPYKEKVPYFLLMLKGVSMCSRLVVKVDFREHYKKLHWQPEQILLLIYHIMLYCLQ